MNRSQAISIFCNALQYTRVRAIKIIRIFMVDGKIKTDISRN